MERGKEQGELQDEAGIAMGIVDWFMEVEGLGLTL